mmetsp:Transcript_52272/g.134885  ORF Transcript_52272/g.134885 Transcript_52272/m.134885 type:complete len:217 (-) Transcript_52272:76-726(-)
MIIAKPNVLAKPSLFSMTSSIPAMMPALKSTIGSNQSPDCAASVTASTASSARDGSAAASAAAATSAIIAICSTWGLFSSPGGGAPTLSRKACSRTRASSVAAMPATFGCAVSLGGSAPASLLLPLPTRALRLSRADAPSSRPRPAAPAATAAREVLAPVAAFVTGVADMPDVADRRLGVAAWFRGFCAIKAPLFCESNATPPRAVIAAPAKGSED